MTTILFISDRNILNPTGERTLIMDRAAVLYQVFGIRTEIQLIRPSLTVAGDENALPLPQGVSVQYSTYRTPLSLDRKMRDVLRLANRMNPAQVVFSGSIVPVWIKKFVDAGHQVTVDIHGDMDEWVEYPPAIFGRPKLGRFLAPAMRGITEYSVKHSDACFVVSKRTEEWTLRKGTCRAFRIPCCTSFIPTRDEWAENRREYRRRLQIPESATVWIYSGGTSGWQLLPETVALANEIVQFDPNAIIVFATSKGESLFEYLGIQHDLGRFRLTSFPSDEVVPALCAADGGFMLRTDSHTNNAAFPNKFSEYLAAGLHIVTGTGLTDPAEVIGANGIGSVIPDSEIRSVSVDLAAKIVQSERRSSSSRWDQSRAALEEIDMRNTLVPYARFLETMV